MRDDLHVHNTPYWKSMDWTPALDRDVGKIPSCWCSLQAEWIGCDEENAGAQEVAVATNCVGEAFLS